MIVTEQYTVNGQVFIRTTSDADRFIVRDGIEYIEAYDPVELGRTYTEGNPIPSNGYSDAERLLDILIGGLV